MPWDGLPLPALNAVELGRRAWHQANVSKNPRMFDAANAARRALAVGPGLPMSVANASLLAKMAALGCLKIRERHYDFIDPNGLRYKHAIAYDTPPTTNNQEGLFAAARGIVLSAPATKPRRMMAAALLVRHKSELWPFTDDLLAGTLCIDVDEGRQELAARDRRDAAAVQREKDARDARRLAEDARLATLCGTLVGHCAANLAAVNVPDLKDIYKAFDSLKNTIFCLHGPARAPATRAPLVAAIQEKIRLVQPFLTVGNRELY